MCLVINYDLHISLNPKIAEEDIFVRKWLKLIDDELYSPYQFELGNKFKWNVGEEPPLVELKPIEYIHGDNVRAHFINEGYHAYRKLNPSDLRISKDDPHCRLFNLMKIPKGTKYFIGVGRDIVAETMVLVDKKQYSENDVIEGLTNVFSN